MMLGVPIAFIGDRHKPNLHLKIPFIKLVWSGHTYGLKMFCNSPHPYAFKCLLLVNFSYFFIIYWYLTWHDIISHVNISSLVLCESQNFLFCQDSELYYLKFRDMLILLYMNFIFNCSLFSGLIWKCMQCSE